MDLNNITLRDRVVFKNNTGKTQTATGGYTDGYNSVYPCRGMLQNIGGSNGLLLGVQGMTTTYTLVVRYSTELAALLKPETIVEVNGIKNSLVKKDLADNNNRYFILTIASKDTSI